MSEHYSEAFTAMIDLYKALGLEAPIQGVWLHKVDDNWTVAINNSGETTEVQPEGAMSAPVERFHAGIWWNGWYAGDITPFGGVLVSHPSDNGANEDNLIKALRSAAKTTAAEGE